METFKAEPLRSENSWRVIGSWGTVAAFRVSEQEAERIAADRNDRARRLTGEADV
jgi:hypothetical protein